MTLRTVTIADTIYAMDGGPATGSVRLQVVTDAALLRSALTPHQLLDFDDVDTATLDGAGAFSIGVVAPGDMLDAATNAAPLVCYYLITRPDGGTIATTAFAYTGTTQSLSDVASTGGTIAAATAPVTFPIGRPSQLGGPLSPVPIVCRLNIDGRVGSQLLLAQDAWSTQVDVSGTATLLLVPNHLITPGGTWWWVQVGSAPPLAITVGDAGGDFLDLLTDPLPGGSLSTAIALRYRGDWTTATPYAINDVVGDGGSAYVAIAPNSSDEPPSANWRLFVHGVGFMWRGAWDSTTHYAVDDAVFEAGSSYVAIAPNVNSTPPSGNWSVIVSSGGGGGGLELTDGTADFANVTFLTVVGSVLTGGPSNAFLTIPGLTQIAQITSAGSASMIVDLHVDTSFYHLLFILEGRALDSATDFTDVGMYLYTDTGAHYNWQMEVVTAGTAAWRSGIADTQMIVGQVANSNALAHMQGAIIIDYPHYSGFVEAYPLIISRFSAWDQLANLPILGRAVGGYHFHGAESRFQFTLGAGTWVDGSMLSIYAY